MERVEERRQVAHRDLDVLHDRLLDRPAAQRVEPVAEPVPAVEGDDAAVDIRAAVAARPEPADDRVLHAQRARAPEPVGVPAPQVVADGQVVDRPLAAGPVEDLLAGVVARGDAGGQRVDELAGGQVLLVRVEDGAVEEVDRSRRRSDSSTIAVGARLRVGVAAVAQPHVRAPPAAGRSPGAGRNRACRRSWGSRGTGRRARRPGVAVTTSPAPVRISISRTDSCGSPCRNDVDSMPSPATAPPRVIVLSCGTTTAASARAAAWRRPGPRRWSCRRRPRCARPGRRRSRPTGPEASKVGGGAPNRNRFELGLPRRTRASGGSSR